MTGFFQQYLQMALAGSLVLVVLLFARLLLKRMPKRFMCFLWMIALFRLLCPYTIEGPVPKFWEREASIEDAGQADTEGVVQRPVTVREPLREQQMGQDWRPGDVMQGDSSPDILEPGNETVEKEPLEEEPLEQEVVDASEEKPSEGLEITPEGEREPGSAEALTHATQNLMEYLFLAAAYVWIIGSLCMAVFLAWKYIRTGSALRESTPLTTRRGIGVRQSDFPGVPMVFGIFQPCIYVPYGFDCEKEQMILEHERVHIRHGDTLCKLLSHIALCVHWWNPLVWLGVSLFHKDMEMACDEAVLEQLTGEGRAEYSRMLLQYAAKRSGLALPMGFGESNTEERIRNILGKKKLPVWGTGLAFVLVVALGICIATKPHEPKHGGEEQPTETEESGTDTEDSSRESTVDTSAEDGTEKQNQSVTDEKTVFIADAMEVEDIFLNRWRKLLKEQGREKETETLEYWAFRNEQHTWWGNLEKERRDLGNSELYFYSISHNGEITVYVTRANVYRTDEGLYAEQILEEDSFPLISEDGVQAALHLEGYPFGNFIPDRSEEAYGWQMEMIQAIAAIYQKEYPEKYQALRDPITAIRELLGLPGEGDFYPFYYNDGIVKWNTTLQDEDLELGFYVRCVNGLWYPTSVKDLNKDQEGAEIFRKNLMSCQEKDAFYATLNTEMLDSDSVGLDDYRQNSSQYISGDYYVVLDRVGDAVLYGRTADFHIILRVDDVVYPLMICWDNHLLPALGAADYDGDGKPEYVIESCNKWGTGYHGTELYMVKPVEGKEKADWKERVSPYLYTDSDWNRELYKRNTYTLDEEAKAYQIDVDGENKCSMDLKPYLKYYPIEDLEGIGFGAVNDFILCDNQWFLKASGGLKMSTRGTLDYTCGVIAVSPVQFHEDHTFSLGEIQMLEGHFYSSISQEEYERIHEREKVIATHNADLDQNGVEDTVVISIAEEENGGSTEEPLRQGGTCRVRVYSGVEEKSYYFQGTLFEKTGGYNVDRALWSSEKYMRDDQGNVLMYLARKDGKDYLVLGTPRPEMGVGTYHFEWIRLLEDAADYSWVVEEAVQKEINGSADATLLFRQMWNGEIKFR